MNTTLLMYIAMALLVSKGEKKVSFDTTITKTTISLSDKALKDSTDKLEQQLIRKIAARKMEFDTMLKRATAKRN